MQAETVWACSSEQMRISDSDELAFMVMAGRGFWRAALVSIRQFLLSDRRATSRSYHLLSNASVDLKKF